MCRRGPAARSSAARRPCRRSPSERSLLRLVGAVLAEQDDIWAGKRYFSEERIAELSKERKPSLPPAPERPEELRETARKAIDASLELADGMETA